MKNFAATIRISEKPVLYSELSEGELFVIQPIYGFGALRMYPSVYGKTTENMAHGLEGGTRIMCSDDLVYVAQFRGITGEL